MCTNDNIMGVYTTVQKQLGMYHCIMTIEICVLTQCYATAISEMNKDFHKYTIIAQHIL